jgi:predicted glycosyltransferase
MNEPLHGKRILIYSHDSFGLGHLRRCRAIAHALVDNDKDISVLIISGSPIIGSFDFRSRVDFIRIPGVIKLRNGEYTTQSLGIDTEQTLAMRASIIQHTAETFEPDIFIVDKEPLGLRGEVRDTLTMLKARGTPTILGLRDVMDEPSLLAPEWERKNVLPALEDLYDEIWVYGLHEICDPLHGLPIPASVRRKMTYTGYLPRFPSTGGPVADNIPFDEPWLLVTTGGGGDGDALIDWVLRAYESGEDLPYPALLVLGPFMQGEMQAEFHQRVARLDRVHAITFDAHIEGLLTRAAGVVAMGGYNTFCEILSFDKKALIVPRTRPRMEQYMRASAAAKYGLVGMLEDDGWRATELMVDALRRLPDQPQPSQSVMPGLLDGFGTIRRQASLWLNEDGGDRPRVVTVAAD